MHTGHQPIAHRGADLDHPATTGNGHTMEPDHLGVIATDLTEANHGIEGAHHPASQFAPEVHGMIFKMGNSSTSLAPSSNSRGMSVFMPSFGTTDSTA